MYERFTDRARMVMRLASEEAQRFNHGYIGTEHVLLGLIEEGSGTAVQILTRLHIDLRRVRAEVELTLQGEAALRSRTKTPQTPRAKKVIEYAMEEARGLNQNYVGTEHVLLGLLREQNGVAAEVLHHHVISVEGLSAEFQKLPPRESENDDRQFQGASIWRRLGRLLGGLRS
jgi:ATP-dependent Clp protease ATP-binding subunit ClpC